MPAGPIDKKQQYDMKSVSMMIRLMALGLVPLALGSCAAAGGYAVTGVSRTRILIDSRYDTAPDSAAMRFIEPYRQAVDSVMSPVMGRSARYMSAGRPESPLSNLLADILVWAGKDYGEQPVMGVYNMGGIRAALPEGDITYGDVLEIAPFENKICFLTLSGEKLMQLFREMASTGGEGVSSGTDIVITEDGRLVSARLNGHDIDPKASYRIATIDYLAQGNDKMTAFKDATDLNSPKEQSNDTRYIISGYFREMARKGVVVDSRIEGRIKMEVKCQ